MFSLSYFRFFLFSSLFFLVSLLASLFLAAGRRQIHLHAFRSLFHETVGISKSKATNVNMIGGKCSGKNFGGSNRETIEIISWLLTGGAERNHKNLRQIFRFLFRIQV
jgi:hypothetical protein